MSTTPKTQKNWIIRNIDQTKKSRVKSRSPRTQNHFWPFVVKCFPTTRVRRYDLLTNPTWILHTSSIPGSSWGPDSRVRSPLNMLREFRDFPGVFVGSVLGREEAPCTHYFPGSLERCCLTPWGHYCHNFHFLKVAPWKKKKIGWNSRETWNDSDWSYSGADELRSG